MGIQVIHHTPQGRISIDRDVLGVARRLQEWDPRFHVNFNMQTKRYEVWRLGEDNIDRLILTCAPDEFDQSLCIKLMDNDTRKFDVLGRIRKHNERLEKSNTDHMVEVEKAAQDYIAWANKKLGYDD